MKMENKNKGAYNKPPAGGPNNPQLGPRAMSKNLTAGPMRSAQLYNSK